jgi:hypothetical protein
VPGELKDAADCIAAYGNLDNLEPVNLPPAEPKKPRERIQVTNDAMAAKWLRRELGRGELAGVFLRDHLLVHRPRMGEKGYLPAKDLGVVDAGPAQVQVITTAGVKALVETRYDCWRMTGKGDDQREVPALFPPQSAQSACEAARLGVGTKNLRTLRGVTQTPMMRPDGSILSMPGYDVATGFLYLPEPELVVPAIPESPTSKDIQAAIDLILTPIAEFPFVSNDDRATWIGLAFTPALRPLLPGPYQMGVITATNPGSGKTKLAKMIGILHGAVERGELLRDADELRKSITGTLMTTTAPVVTSTASVGQPPKQWSSTWPSIPVTDSDELRSSWAGHSARDDGTKSDPVARMGLDLVATDLRGGWLLTGPASSHVRLRLVGRSPRRPAAACDVQPLWEPQRGGRF